MREITIQDILERKAYKEMILDSANMSEAMFKKYFAILEQLEKYFEGNDRISDEVEIEQLSG